jgi:non-heme chloroperoxidase
MTRYATLPVPALFIFGNPHGQGTWVDSGADPGVSRAAKAYSDALAAVTERQVEAIRKGVPTARIVMLPRADHYVYLSTEADVIREIRSSQERCIDSVYLNRSGASASEEATATLLTAL